MVTIDCLMAICCLIKAPVIERNFHYVAKLQIVSKTYGPKFLLIQYISMQNMLTVVNYFLDRRDERLVIKIFESHKKTTFDFCPCCWY